MTDGRYGGKYAFTPRRCSHAPGTARKAFEQNLCAEHGGTDCICAMYDGHTEDQARPYRREHHCECGREWS